MKLDRIAKRFRIDEPDQFRLSKHDPAECCGLTVDKKEAQAMLADGIERLAELQQRLYAEDRWSLLIVLQAMDAAGKDSIIKHVMSGINPQGCEVHSFKQPSAEELQHDFLWRVAQRLPTNGRIGIFNRSHYEEVLTVRVHKDLLARQRLPKERIGKNIWLERFEDIRAFERHLARNGTRILKFFLNVSKDEQRKRFLARIDEPSKRWKFSMSDVTERERWDDYMAAHEDMIRRTSTPEAPWYVVPADYKWFSRVVVAAAVVQELESLNLNYPKVEGKALKELRQSEKALKSGKSG
ncbi:MAG TPA: polyphosphate kinase 2 family protein [Pseudolabrys sp.]|nr:polyphosphate kinase 2 family protein [Pseudolabrys sp.]